MKTKRISAGLSTWGTGTSLPEPMRAVCARFEELIAPCLCRKGQSSFCLNCHAAELAGTPTVAGSGTIAMNTSLRSTPTKVMLWLRHKHTSYFKNLGLRRWHCHQTVTCVTCPSSSCSSCASERGTGPRNRPNGSTTSTEWQNTYHSINMLNYSQPRSQAASDMAQQQ
jgi:hypothetical protein